MTVRDAVARAVAALVDGSLALVLAALLTKTSGLYFAERAVVTLHVGAPDTFWKGSVPMLLGAVSPLAYGTPFAFLLVTSTEAFFATSLGKLLVHRTIVAPAAHRRRRLWQRFGLKTSGAWLACLGFVLGSWPVVLLGGIATAIVLAGCAGIPFGVPALHDRAAGTRLSDTRRSAVPPAAP